MEQTLLLNATFEPLDVLHWQRAMVLWAQGKVEIVETHDKEVRAVSFTFKGQTFAHDACHMDDAHTDYISSPGKRDGTKGWHDAGDYGKYAKLISAAQDFFARSSTPVSARPAPPRDSL